MENNSQMQAIVKITRLLADFTSLVLATKRTVTTRLFFTSLFCSVWVCASHDRACAQQRPPNVDALIADLQTNDSTKQDYALEELGKLELEAKPAVPAIVKLLDPSNAFMIRWKALNTLSRLGPHSVDAKQDIIRCLDDQAENLRNMAISYLGYNRVSEASPKLMQMLQQSTPRDSELIADALGRIGSAEAVKPLTELLPKVQHRTVIYSALLRIKSPEAIEFIRQALNSGDTVKVQEIAAEFENIKGPLLIPELTALLSSQNEKIRWAAARALKSQGEAARSAYPAAEKAMELESRDHRAWWATVLFALDRERAGLIRAEESKRAAEKVELQPEKLGTFDAAETEKAQKELAKAWLGEQPDVPYYEFSGPYGEGARLAGWVNASCVADEAKTELRALAEEFTQHVSVHEDKEITNRRAATERRGESITADSDLVQQLAPRLARMYLLAVSQPSAAVDLAERTSMLLQTLFSKRELEPVTFSNPSSALAQLQIKIRDSIRDMNSREQLVAKLNEVHADKSQQLSAIQRQKLGELVQLATEMGIKRRTVALNQVSAIVAEVTPIVTWFDATELLRAFLTALRDGNIEQALGYISEGHRDEKKLRSYSTDEGRKLLEKIIDDLQYGRLVLDSSTNGFREYRSIVPGEPDYPWQFVASCDGSWRLRSF